MNRYPASLTIIAISVLLGLSGAHAEDAWTNLFDSETLSGWRGYQNAPVEQSSWKVEDGLLLCDEAKPRVDLVTEKQYSNYELIVEWKTVPDGNSGIFIHANESTKRPAFNAPEIQLHAPGEREQPLMSQAGALYSMYPAKPEAVKPAGQWNTTRVVAQGNRLALWHNDVMICDTVIGGGEWNGKVSAGKFADSPEYGKRTHGHIGLQYHGKRVWFRTIKIRNLPPSKEPKLNQTDYPSEVHRITYRSSADNTDQPALFFCPEDESQSVPLLVALHSWSGGFEQKSPIQIALAQWCGQMGWAFIHPHFRGPNWQPDALGSDLVVGDIISAVDFAKSQTKIDPDRIYCVGVSGGGHASMLMAARAPGLWAAVSAWCGISDIRVWHGQCEDSKFDRYAKHIEKVLGGRPDHADATRHRSPIYWIARNRSQLPTLDLWHGVNDGRTGSVPFTHSLYAWNESVAESARLSTDQIESFYSTREFPKQASQSTTSGREIVFQQKSGKSRVSIFDGGHEILPETALNWLAAQRRGQPPVWEPTTFIKIDSQSIETSSGK